MPHGNKHPRYPSITLKKSAPESSAKRMSLEALEVEGHVSDSDSSACNADMAEQPPKWFLLFFEKFEGRLQFTIRNQLEPLISDLKLQEEKLAACNFELEELKAKVSRLDQANGDLLAKIDDIENRGRRNNLVFYGIPEPKDGGKEDTMQVINNLLSNFVGLKEPCPLQRCHRTPTVKQPGQLRPRMIHVAFADFLTKERVRKACIAAFKANPFEGNKVFVAEDLSKRVLDARKSLMESFKKLRAEGKKPFFAYPAVLKYRNDAGHVITVQ